MKNYAHAINAFVKHISLLLSPVKYVTAVKIALTGDVETYERNYYSEIQICFYYYSVTSNTSSEEDHLNCIYYTLSMY